MNSEQRLIQNDTSSNKKTIFRKQSSSQSHSKNQDEIIQKKQNNNSQLLYAMKNNLNQMHNNSQSIQLFQSKKIGFMNNPFLSNNQDNSIIDRQSNPFAGKFESSILRNSNITNSNLFQSKIYIEQNIMNTILDTFYNKQYLLKIHPQLFKQKKQQQIQIELNLQKLKQKTFSYLYIKYKRIIFKKKRYDDHNISLRYNNWNYLCKLIKEKSGTFKIAYKELHLNDMIDLKRRQCSFLNLFNEKSIAMSCQFDVNHQRIYCYNNDTYQILIYGLANKQLLCRVTTKHKRKNPILYLHSIQDKDLLILIGGYQRIDRSIVQGSKYINIYELKNWQITLEAKQIKLSIGRIEPIILTINQNSKRLLILGGNTYGKINKNTIKLNYDYQKDINSSTNFTGIAITTQNLIDCLSGQQITLFNNMNVQINQPMNLYSGISYIRKKQIVLFLPNTKKLFQARIVNKQINISQSKYKQYLTNSSQNFIHTEMKILHTSDSLNLWKINCKGNLEKVQIDSQIPNQVDCFNNNECRII